MGYINTATTTTLIAKLTPLGRRKFIMTNNNLVTSFALGDSDANYYTSLPLTTGEVPSYGGDIGVNNSVSNTVAPNVKIKSQLILDNTAALTKHVEPQSSGVTVEFISNGQSVVTGSNVTQNFITRSDINTDPLVNLYYSFNLPLDSGDDYNFTGVTYANGGYSDTSVSGFSADYIVVIGIDNSQYGELIDGKSIKLDITTLLQSYTIYSTYQNSGTPLANLDVSYTDDAATTSFLGPNIALLFCDDIQKPNGNSNLSWATGYNTVKPFSKNSKQLYNFNTNPSLNEYADIPVGIAYLDRGFIVLTHPTLVQFFDTSSTATTVTFNSLSTTVVQNVTCIANRGEFGTSTNPTFAIDDTPRISEVGLYDMENDLIAIAKLDRQYERTMNDFIALNIKIVV